jgi:cell wall-associated NlpC family hydrolase
LPAHTATYTVVKGDSLTRLAVKFKTTRKKLEELNNLTASKITPGQVLLVPSYKKSKSAGVAKAAKPHHTYPMAQPVQDFDIPASTFASCPVPLPSEENDEPAPATEKPAPIAQLVSPSELAADMAKMQAENDALAAEKHHQTSTSTPYGNAPSGLNSGNGSPIKHSAGGLAATSQKPAGFSQSQNSSSYRTANRSNGYNQPINSPTDDWGTRFLQQARALGNLNLEYDEDWRPPGESHAWTMDCSNTSRYLYKVTTGIELPRTASDQYYYLHLQGKAWDVPQNSQGWADGNYLRQNLKPGDLLFWENTYRPERQPPITHVMVFLGTNAQGQWLMAGSQSSRGGEHNRRNGGPDIYIFRPSQPCGGYTTWLGMVHHQGRFCAFGRPLEADPSKLSVAADD